MNYKAIASIAVLLVLVGIFTIINRKQEEISQINSFETCAAAGLPIMESFPPQCATPDGRTFVQSISTASTTATSSAPAASE